MSNKNEKLYLEITNIDKEEKQALIDLMHYLQWLGRAGHDGDVIFCGEGDGDFRINVNVADYMSDEQIKEMGFVNSSLVNSDDKYISYIRLYDGYKHDCDMFITPWYYDSMNGNKDDIIAEILYRVVADVNEDVEKLHIDYKNDLICFQYYFLYWLYETNDYRKRIGIDSDVLDYFIDKFDKQKHKKFNKFDKDEYKKWGHWSSNLGDFDIAVFNGDYLFKNDHQLDTSKEDVNSIMNKFRDRLISPKFPRFFESLWR